MSVDCSNLDLVDNCRYYFCDLGVAGHILKLTGELLDEIEGILCENFVYLELIRRIQKKEIAGQVPWFATDKKTSGELDFYVRSRLDYRDYGLEVKRGTGRKYSVPLYLCGRISFALGKEDIIG